MAEATNPITTASNPRVGDDVGREEEIAALILTEVPGASDWPNIVYDVAQQIAVKLASAPSPEAGAGGDLGWQPQLAGANSLGRDRKGDVTINVPTALCWLQFRPDVSTGTEEETRPGVGFALVAYPGSAGEWPNGVIPRDEAFKLYEMLGRFFEKHPPSDAPSTTEMGCLVPLRGLTPEPELDDR